MTKKEFVLIKRVTLAIIGLSLATPALAQQKLEPRPLPQKGSCPSGYTSDSRFCTPGWSSKFAILKAQSGSCPSGYSSEGAYCVAQGFARFAMPKTGGSGCPSGYTNDGDFCVSGR